MNPQKPPPLPKEEPKKKEQKRAAEDEQRASWEGMGPTPPTPISDDSHPLRPA